MQEIKTEDIIDGDVVRIEDGDTSIECKATSTYIGYSDQYEMLMTIHTEGMFTFKVPYDRKDTGVKVFLLRRSEPTNVGAVVEVHGKQFTRVRTGSVCWVMAESLGAYTWDEIIQAAGGEEFIKVVRP